MQSPYKKIIVYDYETGGFSPIINGLTEFAMVVIDLESLEIIDQVTALIKPRLDLRHLKGLEPRRILKDIYKAIGHKDADSGIKVIDYKGHKVTLKNLEQATDDMEDFLFYLEDEAPNFIIEHNQLLVFEADEDVCDIVKLLFDYTYTKSALDATHIYRPLFEGEGVESAEAFKMMFDTIEKHTHGNSKPIMSGHNIGTLPQRMVKGKLVKADGFDNPFSEKIFKDNGSDYFAAVNDLFIDTLKEARVQWFEAPSHALGSCANMLDITLKEAHRALPDTLANAKVLIKMLKMRRGLIGGQEKQERKKFTANF